MTNFLPGQFEKWVDKNKQEAKERQLEEQKRREEIIKKYIPKKIK